jgi:2-polyprenyl-3-methyl-5-hydroxy-6-metoxy-1,4-benzoquinol methylase
MMRMSSIYESLVDPLRPNDAHGISLQLVGQNKRVLELGAASGHVTKALVSQGNTVAAVERDGRFAEQLLQVADEVHITDLDWLDLVQTFGQERFDVILAGDVLEHCTRPDLVLLQCHHLLAEGGYIVVSLPNIAHADVRLALLTGKFEYRPTGLLDSTHLRFFTRETIESFVLANGFKIEEIFASTAPLGCTELGPPDDSVPREAIDFVQRDRDSLVYQYVMRLRPTVERPEITLEMRSDRQEDQLLAELSLSQEALSFTRAQLLTAHTEGLANRDALERLHLIELEEARSQAEEARAQANQLEESLATSRTRLHELNAVLEVLQSENEDYRMKLLHTRDAVIGASAELGTMRARYEATQSQVDSLVHQLNLLHTSRTWRIGRFVLLPLRAVRWMLRKLNS